MKNATLKQLNEIAEGIFEEPANFTPDSIFKIPSEWNNPVNYVKAYADVHLQFVENKTSDKVNSLILKLLNNYAKSEKNWHESVYEPLEAYIDMNEPLEVVDNVCHRFVNRCAKMHRLDLIDKKYDCYSCHTDEMEAFWNSWSEVTGLDYRDLSEREAINVQSNFSVENTEIVLFRSPF